MACINVNHRRRPAPAKTQDFKGLPDTCEDLVPGTFDGLSPFSDDFAVGIGKLHRIRTWSVDAFVLVFLCFSVCM